MVALVATAVSGNTFYIQDHTIDNNVSISLLNSMVVFCFDLRIPRE
jgi:hypothetical protein